MANDNVISLNAVRQIRQTEEADYEYRALILQMDKLELLDEMVRFQKERSEKGFLTPTMMTRGQVLFKALEETAETQELKLLTKAYRRHLEQELSEYRRSGGTSIKTDAEFELEQEAE